MSQPISKLLSTVNSPEGWRRLAEHLDSQPYPHYESASGSSGLLVRIEADGTRTVGRFVGREFRRADLDP